MADETVISTRALSKRYRHRLALDSVNLEVSPGEVFAVIGPNGAGKTTLLKLLLNLIPASSGEARVLGVDSRRIGPAFLQRIGYVSESQRLPRRLSVAALCRYLGHLYTGWDEALAQQLTKEFDLPTTERIGTLSRGGKAKLRMLCAMAYRPELLIVDEMFSGLDPLIRDQLMEGVLDLAAGEGWSVLLSSHEMLEVERLAEAVAFLDQGRVIFRGEVAELLDAHRLIHLHADRPLEASETLPSTWIERRLSEQDIQIVDSAFDQEAIGARLAAVYGDGYETEISTMSLRDIFVARAREQRQEVTA